MIVAWSLEKPQYGAFAAPLAVLFVLSLMSTVLYAAAALAGAISDHHVARDGELLRGGPVRDQVGPDQPSATRSRCDGRERILAGHAGHVAEGRFSGV